MPYEDYTDLQDADFENLPPLVKKGEDRKEVLQRVIDGWLSTEELVEEINFDAIENHKATLKRVDLRDDNPGADPIDLGEEILRPLAKKRLQSNPQNKIVVPLLGCKINSINANEIDCSKFQFLLIGSQIMQANFRNAIFSEKAIFSYVYFAKGANFDGATFWERADFSFASFVEAAHFDSTLFGKQSSFFETTFGKQANFSYTTFKKEVMFFRTSFGEGTIFYNVDFLEPVNFGLANFSKKISIYECDLRAVKLESSQLDLRRSDSWNYSWKSFRWLSVKESWNKTVWPFLTKDRTYLASFQDVFSIPMWLLIHLRQHVDWQWVYDLAQWKRVRSLGELTALTRISYYSLFAVPLLAGIWRPAQAWLIKQNSSVEDAARELKAINEKLSNATEKIPDSQWIESQWIPFRESIDTSLRNVNELFAPLFEKLGDGLQDATIPAEMPTGWLLAFFAALAIWLGHAVYQIFCPELLRNNSEEDLIEKAEEINRLDGATIRDERLRQAIDYLQTAARILPHRHAGYLVKRENRVVWIPEKVDERFNNATKNEPKPEGAPEDWEPDPDNAVPAQQEVDAEDRKRITIEEGQKARYDRASFEKRRWAWIAGGLYGLGGWLLAMIILRQLGYVMVVSPVIRLWPFIYETAAGETVSRVTLYGEIASYGWGWTTVIVSLLIFLLTAFFAFTVTEPGEE